MTRRAWLRHPPRTIRPTLTCPTGQARYTSVARAQDALTVVFADAHLTATHCDECGGAHHTPTNTPETR